MNNQKAWVTIGERFLIIRQSRHYVHHILVLIQGTDCCGEHYLRNQLILFFKHNRRGRSNRLCHFGGLGSIQGLWGEVACRIRVMRQRIV